VNTVLASVENGSATGCTSIAFWLLLNLSTQALSLSPRPDSAKVAPAKVRVTLFCALASSGMLPRAMTAAIARPRPKRLKGGCIDVSKKAVAPAALAGWVRTLRGAFASIVEAKSTVIFHGISR
jgi:hypothetical protein